MQTVGEEELIVMLGFGVTVIVITVCDLQVFVPVPETVYVVVTLGESVKLELPATPFQL
jgi:hypothetical protein